jgi:hypothetical protein
MKFPGHLWLALAITLAAPAIHAQRILGYVPPTTTHLSRHDLRGLVRSAATPEQCEFLSRYFRDRSQEYRDEAWQMNTIVLQRQIVGANAGGRYWASVQSGSSLHRYYASQARDMEQRAEEFDARARQLSENRTPKQPTTPPAAE